MLVTTAISGSSSRNVPSLSSASMTIHSPLSHTALVPISLTSPPMRKLGRNPASIRIRASMEVVVVLPWVPDTATHRRHAAIAASAWARLSSTRPRRRASVTSGFASGTAVDRATTSASATWTASWPTKTLTPLAANRSSAGELLRSLPVTRWPMAASTEAMALIPAPPAPTTCTRRGRERSRGTRAADAPGTPGAAPVPLGADGSRSEGMGRLGSPVRGAGMVPGQADHGRHGVGAPQRAGRQRRMAPSRPGSDTSASISRARRSGLHWESGTTTAAPARSRTARVGVLVVSGRSGQRHENRRAPRRRRARPPYWRRPGRPRCRPPGRRAPSASRRGPARTTALRAPVRPAPRERRVHSGRGLCRPRRVAPAHDVVQGHVRARRPQPGQPDHRLVEPLGPQRPTHAAHHEAVHGETQGVARRGAGRGVGMSAVDDPGAHRRARHHRPRQRGAVERHRGAAGEASHQAVGGAGHGVDVHEHDGDARDGRRQRGRHARVPAHRHHHRRPAAGDDHERRHEGGGQTRHRAQVRHQRARVETSGDAATGQQRGRHPLPRQQLGVETPA